MAAQEKQMTLNQAIDYAVDAYNSGHGTQAMDIYKKILTSDPQNPFIYVLLGGFMERINERANAAQLYSHALQLDSTLKEAQESLARVQNVPDEAQSQNN